MSRSLHLQRIVSAPPPPRGHVSVAILTGQADLRSSPLSDVQKRFLDALDPRSTRVLAGFPFDGRADAPQQFRMLAASVANARQYVWAHVDETYRRLVRSRLEVLAQAADQALVLVTGSCGLAIAHAALDRSASAARVHILALGPAGTAPSGLASYRAVQGARDGWSRALYRGPAAEKIDCGHMDYWTHPRALEIAQTLVASLCDR